MNKLEKLVLLTIKLLGSSPKLFQTAQRLSEKWMLQVQENSSNPVLHSSHCLLFTPEEKSKHPLAVLSEVREGDTTDIIVRVLRALQRLGFPSMFQSDYRQKSHTVVLFTKQLVCNFAELLAMDNNPRCYMHL